MRRWLPFLRAAAHLVPIALLAALIAIVAARTCAPTPRAALDEDAAPRPVVARGDLADDERSTIELFERCAPSVVHVTSVRRVGVRGRNPFEVPQGAGTGFVWDASGYVVTNFHVVAQASDFRITLSDRTELPATVVGSSDSHDLAVLKVEPGDVKLTALPLGTSADLRVGQRVFAIGNPFGLDQTLTTGIISGLNRQIHSPLGRPIFDVIQTDAAINPGNSGGPLLDSAGRVIGVNTAILSPTGTSAGIGFAVPVDTANRVVPEILRTGKYRRAALGILVARDEDAQAWGVEGVLVDDLLPGGGAEKAGLRGTAIDESGKPRLGDVIVEVAGRPVRKRDDLFRALDRREIGERVPLRVVRDGAEELVEVELGVAE